MCIINLEQFIERYIFITKHNMEEVDNMASIKDVAKLAGVSVSAVSKYLKTPQNMRDETREKISGAIQQLQFHPNQLARSLRTGRSGIIAIFVPEVDNLYFSNIFMHIQHYCNDRNLLPLLLSNKTEQEIINIANLLKSGVVDGAVYYDDGQAPSISKYLGSDADVPLVRIGGAAHKEHSAAIHIDFQSAFTQLSEHLIQKGVSRLAYIWPANDNSSRQKFQAVQACCERLNIELITPAHISSYYGYMGGYKCCIDLLKTLPAPPEGIICESDMIAMGALKGLTHLGLDVPEDMFISGCDNTHISVMSNPSLTSVNIPIENICFAAMETLCNMIAGKPYPAYTVFECQPVYRTSTGDKQGFSNFV